MTKHQEAKLQTYLHGNGHRRSLPHTLCPNPGHQASPGIQGQTCGYSVHVLGSAAWHHSSKKKIWHKACPTPLGVLQNSAETGMCIGSETLEWLVKKSSILKEKVALGWSDGKQLNAHLTQRKGLASATQQKKTEKAPDGPGHMPSALLPVGGEAVTPPRNEFTKRHQPLPSICASTQQELLQLPRPDSAMPYRGKARARGTAKHRSSRLHHKPL